MNAVARRRSLTPSAGASSAAKGTHAMRRGTTRKEVTERVTLKSSDGRVLEGWALNASRGGVRVILEEKVDLGHEFEVLLGDVQTATSRRGRIVWLQDEPDGVIVGVEYTGLSGIHRSADASGVHEGGAHAVLAPERLGQDGADGSGVHGSDPDASGPDASGPDASGLAARVSVETDPASSGRGDAER